MVRSLALVGCVWLITGCFLSVDGYQPDWDQDLTDALVGTWGHPEPEEDPATATVTVGDGGVLAIEYRDEHGKRGRFHALVGRLGEHVVLDVWPVSFDEDSLSDTYTSSMIPGHSLLAVTLTEDELVLRLVDPDVLKADLKSGVLDLPFVSSGEGNVILTADSEKLHEAFAAYLSRPGVFGDGEPGVWRRTTRR